MLIPFIAITYAINSFYITIRTIMSFHLFQRTFKAKAKISFFYIAKYKHRSFPFENKHTLIDRVRGREREASVNWILVIFFFHLKNTKT